MISGETAEQERDRLRKELANERADCAVAIEALREIAGIEADNANDLNWGHAADMAQVSNAALAKLGASK